MTDIHAIIRNLKSKNNQEENLKAYFEELSGRYEQYFTVTLAFSFLELCGILKDAADANEAFPDIYDGTLSGICTDLSEALQAYYLNGDAVSSGRMTALRSEHIAAVERISNAVDVYTLDEYILNRIEYRFAENGSPEKEFTDGDLTDMLIAWLTGIPRDVQNLSIARIVEQLPVRMTKNRFYEMLSERLGIYKESDTEALSSVVSMLLSASGLNEDLPADPLYAPLIRMDQALRTDDLKNVSKKDFEIYENTLLASSIALNRNMDLGSALQNVLNAFSGVLLSGGHGSGAASENAGILISKTLEWSENCQNGMDELYALCEKLEGVLEETREKIEEAAGVLESIRLQYGKDDAETEESCRTMEMLSILSGNSAFAPLEPVQGVPVSDAFLREKEDLVLKRYASLFEEVKRPYLRAAMARAISVLPPHFSTQEEVENYIMDSLSGCRDEAEKRCCTELLKKITEE